MRDDFSATVWHEWLRAAFEQANLRRQGLPSGPCVFHAEEVVHSLTAVHLRS